MANGGVLFLDEFPEWPRPARESSAPHHGHWCARPPSGRRLRKVAFLCLDHGCHEHVCVRSEPSLVCVLSSERKQYMKRLSGPLVGALSRSVGSWQRPPHHLNGPWQECQRWVQRERTASRSNMVNQGLLNFGSIVKRRHDEQAPCNVTCVCWQKGTRGLARGQRSDGHGCSGGLRCHVDDPPRLATRMMGFGSKECPYF